jgi:hypothetical protein
VDTQNELLAYILDAAASVKKCADLLKQHVIFAHELQIALRLMVGF